MKALFFVALFCVSLVCTAQSNPCLSKPYEDFDFWVGHWVVKDSLNQVLGSSKITKINKGCALLEQWTGKNGFQGTSLNYYNPNQNTWNQLWLDQAQTKLELTGKLENNTMVLTSKILKDKNGNEYYNRIRWISNPDATVEQVWETLDNKHQIIKELFRGTYYEKIRVLE